MSNDVLERKVFHAGQTIIAPDEKHGFAYMLQNGQIMSFVIDGGEKVPVDTHTAGDIIGEGNLLIDSNSEMGYDAVEDTTVVRISNQDFQVKFKKVDGTIVNIVETMAQKLRRLELEKITTAREKNKISDKAYKVVDHLLRSMAGPRRHVYEKKLLPLFNDIVNTLDELRTAERHEKQKAVVAEKVAEIKGDGKGAPE